MTLLEEKARTHIVEPTPEGFTVTSGWSGETYLVVPLTTGGAACNCKHARSTMRIASGCSHVLAVVYYAAQMTGQMRRVCAWCQADMGSKPCLPELTGQVTHGICPACQEKL